MSRELHPPIATATRTVHAKLWSGLNINYETPYTITLLHAGNKSYYNVSVIANV